MKLWFLPVVIGVARADVEDHPPHRLQNFPMRTAKRTSPNSLVD